MKRKPPRVGILAGIVFAAVGTALAMQLYYVQDMLAALLLFFVAFSVVAAMILILFLLHQVLDWAVACAGRYVVLAAQRLRQGCVKVGQFGREHSHRSAHSAER